MVVFFCYTMRCPEQTRADMKDAFKRYHTQTNPHMRWEGITMMIKLYHITQLHSQSYNSRLLVKLEETVRLSFYKAKRGQAIWKVKWPICDCQLMV